MAPCFLDILQNILCMESTGDTAIEVEIAIDTFHMWKPPWDSIMATSLLVEYSG